MKSVLTVVPFDASLRGLTLMFSIGLGSPSLLAEELRWPNGGQHCTSTQGNILPLIMRDINATVPLSDGGKIGRCLVPCSLYLDSLSQCAESCRPYAARPPHQYEIDEENPR